MATAADRYHQSWRCRHCGHVTTLTRQGWSSLPNGMCFQSPDRKHGYDEVRRPEPDGTETITLARAKVEALYVSAANAQPYDGSDEWDLNDAYQQGAMAALDAVRGLRDL